MEKMRKEFLDVLEHIKNLVKNDNDNILEYIERKELEIKDKKIDKAEEYVNKLIEDLKWWLLSKIVIW